MSSTINFLLEPWNPRPLEPFLKLMETIWDKKRSEWYCRAIEQSNYPKNTVAALSQMLRNCETVLDIGAGCGALSLPLAQRVGRVTAVEPSRWMFNLLLERAGKAGIQNIRALNTGWKVNRLPRDIQPHDMIICANLPYSMVCNVHFLRFLKERAKKYIVIIQNAGTWNRFYYRELYPLLLRKKYINRCNYILTYNFLHKHGILANVKMFEYTLDQPFESFDEALAFWKHRLDIRFTPEKERILARFLRKRLVTNRKTNTVFAPFGTRKSALMWWKT